jgi:hypothetical protein
MNQNADFLLVICGIGLVPLRILDCVVGEFSKRPFPLAEWFP